MGFPAPSYWRWEGRHNSTKMEGHEVGTTPQIGGACAPVAKFIEMKGKGFTASKENNNFPQNGMSAFAGWDDLWAWAMDGAGRQILHMV